MGPNQSLTKCLSHLSGESLYILGQLSFYLSLSLSLSLSFYLSLFFSLVFTVAIFSAPSFAYSFFPLSRRCFYDYIVIILLFVTISLSRSERVCTDVSHSVRKTCQTNAAAHMQVSVSKYVGNTCI